MLKFPDRSEVSIQKAAAWGSSAGKVPVFLSCEAAEFLAGEVPGVSSVLTYREAVEISNRLLERLPKRVESMRELAESLAGAVESLEPGVKRRVQIEMVVRKVGKTPLVGLALVLVACAVDEDCELLPS